MGQIENMQQSDVDNLRAQIEALNQLPREVPMTFKTFPQEDLDFAKRLTSLEEKVNSILVKLTHIFGDAVLIEGKFREIKIPK